MNKKLNEITLKPKDVLILSVGVKIENITDNLDISLVMPYVCEIEETEKIEKVFDVMKFPISEMMLSRRTESALGYAGVKTIKDIMDKYNTERKLLEIDGFGAKGMQEVKRFLSDYDLKIEKNPF